MNLSDDSSSEEEAVPIKRPRADTYGASSTTSYGSAQQESDEEPTETKTVDNYGAEFQQPNKLRHYTENSPEGNIRLSRSSLSENCSSPNEHDDYRPGFESDADGEAKPSFQDDFYSKSYKESDSISGDYSAMSKKMMSSMGYKPGKGLGKFEHGRTEPVEASVQKGRRGLGLKASTVGEVPRDFKWSSDDSTPGAKEEVVWLPPPPEDPVTGDLLEEWMKRGPKKLTINDETNFVDPQVLNGVLDAKTIFDSLDDEDLRQARFRSNPYETIGSVIFLNRAAVKMANMDAVFDFMFTSPKKQNGEKMVDDKDILYFADVCAGPGGFSEYILYKCGWKAKGFGFTLKGQNDFKLSDFYAGPPETFNPYYGEKGDGNVFDPANLRSLKEQVLKHTDDKGVHFLMADGGFSVDGQENIQEILSKQLYLCQCLAALMLVRTGGHFVVKLFDVFTVFSVGLLYIMYRCFEKVCIHKPVTSRPDNSERYLVCKWKKLGTEASEQHLFIVNSILWSGLENGEDVTELVPLSVIQEDAGFYEYIYNSNCVLGESQIKHLLKIAAYSKDKNLKDENQATIKEQCLKAWQLKDTVRKKPERHSPDDTLLSMLSAISPPIPDSQSPQVFKSNVLLKPPEYLTKSADLENFKNVYDWHFVFLSSGKSNNTLRIFLGCGIKQVYQLEPSGWKSVVDLNLILPAKTLIYGEIVKEYKGEGKKQSHVKSLHIIDAMMLGGVDISHHTLTERIRQCNLFCAAVNKPFDQASLQMSCKRLFNLEKFDLAMNHLECRAMKLAKRAVTIDSSNRINRNEMFYVVGSILFIKEIKEPWSAQISKKSGYKYYYSIGKDRKPRSEYHIVKDACLDIVSAYKMRIMWPWEPSACAIFDKVQHEGVSRTDFEDYIRRNTKR